ncbi:SRPBCC family protein [Occallatibacter savannae]|uniref:SRPBCC family protein n=1 Tax=Occallatibacter savannae TaxID=1002691 RepID=UPI000D69AE46|nr:SRPBCC family protein [Occallatibacter savannae]
MNPYNSQISGDKGPQDFLGSKGILIGAAALLAYGITRRSKTSLALATAGGLLAATSLRSNGNSQAAHTRATFLVNTSPEKAYALWRDFSNLARFMRHVKSVEVLDDTHSEWVVRGPMDKEIRWYAEITEDVKNERISWRSRPDSLVQTSGSVEFRPHRAGRGTYVSATVRYTPGGTLSKTIATLLGKHPQFMVREDVRRFKALLEAGETPTTIGQSHGPRGVHGSVEQVLFRETGNLADPQAAQAYSKTA